jgi:hypothetical protein
MNQTPPNATHPGRRAQFSPLMQHRARRPLHSGHLPTRVRTDADRQFTKALRAAELAAWEAALPKAAGADERSRSSTMVQALGRVCFKCWIQAGLAIGATVIALRAVLA